MNPEDTNAVTDPVLQGAPSDASTTEAELNAKIDQELGIPPQPAKEEPTPEETEEPNPDAPEEVEEDLENEEQEQEDQEEPEPKAPAEPATPSDSELFIEVEDAEGVTHKISKIEDLPEDFEPKNNREALKILKELGDLENKIADREANAATAEEQAAKDEAIQETFKAWDAEIATLAASKRIDTADTDRVEAVFTKMREMNDARTKAGNPNMVTSFEDALMYYERDEAAAAEEAAKKNGNDLAKAKSSFIGGSSAKAGDDYVYRAGSARSIDDIPLS